MEQTWDQMSGSLLGVLAAGAAVCLFAAAILRTTSRWVAGADVPYGQAYFTVFVPCLIVVGLRTLLGFAEAVVTVSESNLAIMAIAMAPVTFLIQVLVVKWWVTVSFWEAILITLIMSALVVGLVAIVVLIFFGAFSLAS